MFKNNINITDADFITGEKFAQACDFVHYHYGRQDAEILPTHRLFFSDTDHVQALLVRLPLDRPVVVVTHNEDIAVDDALAALLPANAVWFGQNVACVHPRIESIPIGLENQKWSPHLRKKQRMLAMRAALPAPSRLLYVNHTIRTNPGLRSLVYKLFRGRKWATCVDRGDTFDPYLHGLVQHFYVASPEGHGIDCVRTWEAMYMGRVPVTTRNLNTRFYEDLPILLVDRWEDVTEDLLLRNRDHFLTAAFNLEKLRMSYWLERIKGKA